MLSSHYRKPIEFSEEELSMAKAGLERVENCIRRIKEVLEKAGTNCSGAEDFKESVFKYRDKFCEGMEEDFNTSMAFAAIFEMIKEINRYIDSNNQEFSEEGKKPLREAEKVIISLMEDVMGIKIEFKLWNNPDELRALILKKEVDFIALPTNVATNLYNKGIDLKLLNVSTWAIS